MKTKFRNRLSFSLLEIIVVTTIIGLLGTAGFSSFSTANKNSRDTKRKADLESVKSGLSLYYQVNGVYPTDIPWGGTPFIENNNKYIENTPQDPLAVNDYRYYYSQTSDDSFVVCTRLENNADTNEIDNTRCKLDGTKCNYCATLTGNYLAQTGQPLSAESMHNLTCTGSCTGKCGGDSDGCNSQCPNPCNTNQVCLTGGTCCTPQCTGKCTGADDGCGGTCTNSCQTGYSCVSGTCVSDFPVGGITFIATSVVPTGFLECNGQSTSGYPELAAVVGGNVPNLKGQFIRGWNSGRGTPQTLDSGRTLLSTQTDLLRSHTHSYNPPQWVTGPYFQVGGYNIVGVPATSGSTGGSETRPYNVALMAIIKY